MRTWLRELLGLFFAFFGLFVWVICIDFFYAIRLIEAGFLFFMGMISFKAGIHLIRVGMAARILLTGDDAGKAVD